MIVTHQTMLVIKIVGANGMSIISCTLLECYKASGMGGKGRCMAMLKGRVSGDGELRRCKPEKHCSIIKEAQLEGESKAHRGKVRETPAANAPLKLMSSTHGLLLGRSP